LSERLSRLSSAESLKLKAESRGVHVLGTVCANESNLSAEAAEEIPAEEIHDGANLTFSDPQAAFYIGVPSALKIHDHLILQ